MKRDGTKSAERQYDASLDIWQSMAYSVAKELNMRPMTILTEWSCEELLVAYGVYANVHSKENFDMMSKAERRKKNLNYFDRWAVPFFSREQVAELGQVVEEAQKEQDDLNRIAEALFSW